MPYVCLTYPDLETTFYDFTSILLKLADVNINQASKSKGLDRLEAWITLVASGV